MSRLQIKHFEPPGSGSAVADARPSATPATAAPAPPALDPDLRPLAEYLDVHRATEGWFAFESAAIWDSLLAFQEQRQFRGHLLEIGVYKGKSAALLARRTRGEEHLWLVDRFLRREDVEATLRRVRSLPSPRVHLENHDSYLLHTHPGLAGQERSFRFVHIDGEHSGAAIQNDLALAHRYGSPQVLVSVDDIFQWVYPQLTESLFRYLRQHPDQFTMILVGYNKAYLARPSHAHFYLQYLREELVPRLERIGIPTTLSKSTTPAELNAFGIGPRLDVGPYRGLDHQLDQLPY
jgi:predicted O-methyltransferase YrrM